jgi:PAS domain S-box-containing protein
MDQGDRIGANSIGEEPISAKSTLPAAPNLPIERLPLGYLAFDAEQRVLDWNPAAEQMFGYSKAEVLGRQIVELIVPLPAQRQVQEITQRIFAGDMEAHSINENRTKDGRIITCAWFNTPICRPDGTYAGCISLVQDVTSQRLTEDRRREIEERFIQLAEHIDGYFWLNSLDDREMYYMSPGYEKLTGRSCASLYQRPESWTEIIHPDDRERILLVMLGPPDKEARTLEYRIVRPDGSIRWIRDRAFPVRDSAGKVYRIAGIGEDVTEHKQAEQELANYASRLQTLSHRLVEVQEEERHRLARELHDEIGQLLTSVRFALDEGARGPATLIQGKLNEARALIEEAMTRVRELAFELRPALLDHFGLLSALRFLIERFTAATGVSVNFHCAELSRFTPEVETAAYRLVQEALTNVARHADVKDVAVRIWIADDALNVQIEDEGIGFDPEAAAANGGSHGIAGMHERVRLLGGRLAVHSAPGSGTHILAQFPVGGRSRKKTDDYFHSPGR